VACIGLEPAPERLEDYAGWGFRPAWRTLRWILPGDSPRPRLHCRAGGMPPGWRIVPAAAVPESVVQAYDARHEVTPRPHFLREWLRPDGDGTPAPENAVLVVLDRAAACRGFARIRPCLLPPAGDRPLTGPGWRLGPWLADDPDLAGALLDGLCGGRAGPVLVDAPGINPQVAPLLRRRGFHPGPHTIRM
jgi:ribosomal-protein-alanine N-acetyltransferase